MGDEVLFMVLRCLPLEKAVLLTSASSSLGTRLAGTPAETGSGHNPTQVELLITAYVGCEITEACAKSIANSVVPWPLSLARALTSTLPKAVALRHAIDLANGDSSSSPSTAAFLEAVFRAETGKVQGPNQNVVAVWDTAMRVILLSCQQGPKLMLASAEAVKQAEEDLDALFNVGQDLPREYEAIARQRSAAKSLLERFKAEAEHASVDHQAAASAMVLDDAVLSLDTTIDTYMANGLNFLTTGFL